MHKREKINKYHRTHGSHPSVTGPHVPEYTHLSLYGAPSLAEGFFQNWLDQVGIVCRSFLCYQFLDFKVVLLKPVLCLLSGRPDNFFRKLALLIQSQVPQGEVSKAAVSLKF